MVARRRMQDAAETIAVIGAGKVGRALARRAAVAGFRVVLEDLIPISLEVRAAGDSPLARRCRQLRPARSGHRRPGLRPHRLRHHHRRRRPPRPHRHGDRPRRVRIQAGDVLPARPRLPARHGHRQQLPRARTQRHLGQGGIHRRHVFFRRPALRRARRDPLLGLHQRSAPSP